MPKTHMISVRVTSDDYDRLVALGEKQSVPVKPATMAAYLISKAVGSVTADILSRLKSRAGVAVVFVCAALSLVACSGVPSGPTPANGTAAWALAHVNDICVAYPAIPGTGVYGKGVLQSVTLPVPSGGIVVSISYCNPAE